MGISTAETEKFDVGGGESTAALAEMVRRKAKSRRERKWRCILAEGWMWGVVAVVMRCGFVGSGLSEFWVLRWWIVLDVGDRGSIVLSMEKVLRDVRPYA